MKQIIVTGAVCCLLASIGSVAYNNNKDVIVEHIMITTNKKVIPVTVTLTKYQLEKMLNLLEEENSYGRPADPQDEFTFTSVARESSLSTDDYSISSTHLARKPY